MRWGVTGILERPAASGRVLLGLLGLEREAGPGLAGGKVGRWRGAGGDAKVAVGCGLRGPRVVRVLVPPGTVTHAAPPLPCFPLHTCVHIHAQVLLHGPGGYAQRPKLQLRQDHNHQEGASVRPRPLYGSHPPPSGANLLHTQAALLTPRPNPAPQPGTQSPRPVPHALRPVPLQVEFNIQDSVKRQIKAVVDASGKTLRTAWGSLGDNTFKARQQGGCRLLFVSED